MSKLKNIIRVLLRPGCWIQNGRYSAMWDARLRNLLKNYKFRNCDGYTADIGSVKVWIANHPYASMTPYEIGVKLDVRPKRALILEAHERLVSDVIGKEIENENN